jgi:hypothetical protein
MASHSTRGRPAGAVLGIALLLGLVLTAFALPAINQAPRDLPIGVAGPAAVTSPMVSALGSRQPGAFAVRTYGDAASLTTAIREREVYGGLAVAPSGPQLLTAPAGSPAVAQVLTALAAGLAQQTGQQVPVVEVVPLPAEDPRGAGLPAALLPLLIGSVAPVVAMVLLVRGTWARLAGVLVSSAVTGATLALLMHWYGIFVGDWLLDAAAMSAVVAAMSTALLGLVTVAGWPGLGLGVAIFLLLGNPLSGVATAPEFLPTPWSTLGSWLPPGAAGQLLRSTAYFDGAAASQPLVVLGAWFVFGLVLLGAGSRRGKPASPASEAAALQTT